MSQRSDIIVIYNTGEEPEAGAYAIMPGTSFDTLGLSLYGNGVSRNIGCTDLLTLNNGKQVSMFLFEITNPAAFEEYAQEKELRITSYFSAEADRHAERYVEELEKDFLHSSPENHTMGRLLNPCLTGFGDATPVIQRPAAHPTSGVDFTIINNPQGTSFIIASGKAVDKLEIATGNYMTEISGVSLFGKTGNYVRDRSTAPDVQVYTLRNDCINDFKACAARQGMHSSVIDSQLPEQQMDECIESAALAKDDASAMLIMAAHLMPPDRQPVASARGTHRDSTMFQATAPGQPISH